jgi:hypothetical protein
MEALVNQTPTAFYLLGIACALSILVSAINALRGKPSWGQARVMGVTSVLFGWINLLFYFAVFQAGYGIVSAILNFPDWIDILLSILLFVFAAIIYFLLSARSTFKPEPFIAVVLLPLSLTGVKIVNTSFKEGTLLVNKVGLFYVPEIVTSQTKKLSKIVTEDVKRAPKLLDNISLDVEKINTSEAKVIH